MEFRILGPLEVVDDGVSLPLGGPKPRSVLAVLLLARGRVVSSDMVIDAIWGEEPPAAAANLVQTYVSHLRKALGADRIVTQAPGYRLTRDEDEVDAERFERLTTRARAERLAGDPERAAAVLSEALGLAYGWCLTEFEELADRNCQASVLASLAWIDRERGDVAGASERLRDSLALRRGMRDMAGLAEVLEGVAGIGADAGDAWRAAALAARAQRLREEIGAVPPGWQHERLRGELSALRRALAAGAYREATDQGAALGLEDALDMAADVLNGARVRP